MTAKTVALSRKDLGLNFDIALYAGNIVIQSHVFVAFLVFFGNFAKRTIGFRN